MLPSCLLSLHEVHVNKQKESSPDNGHCLEACLSSDIDGGTPEKY